MPNNITQSFSATPCVIYTLDKICMKGEQKFDAETSIL